LVFLLLLKFDSEVSEFLSVLKYGTRNVYSRGLAAFQHFYLSQGSIEDFLDCVLLNSFVALLKDRGYSPKTVRIYMGAV